VHQYPTRFTDLVGCRWPVQLAAMGGGVGGPGLAAAVQETGGLGMVSWGEEIPEGCGLNILAPFLPSPEQVADAAGRATVVAFFYREPAPGIVAAVHHNGALAGWQVGSTGEAVAAASAGCDYVIAQGVEAGGHVRGTVALEQLLADVVERVQVPVLAAGGIATGERVAQLLSLGAEGVRVGTRFLTCAESNAHEDYVARLLAASGEDTCLTEWFGDGWPDAPHRVLRDALEHAQASGCRSPLPPARGHRGTIRDCALYAGAGVGDVTTVETVAQVVADLMRPLLDGQIPAVER
jgi:nitronate monooxygenase